VRMQPVDSDEFARVVAACVTDGDAGVRPEFAGPEALTMRELAEQYLAARGLERRVRTLPLPRRMAAALEAGGTAPGAATGEVTWTQWLRSHPQAGAPRGSVRAA
jgi:uncharacterized protein YbjT (DUF2867 family)